MKIWIALIFILVSVPVFSQTAYFTVTRIETGKVKYFEPNKRIKVKLMSGEVFKGKLGLDMGKLDR